MKPQNETIMDILGVRVCDGTIQRNKNLCK